MKDLWAVVLAAGEGKRMRSRLPKVLHPICGKPMLHYIAESAAALTDNVLIVVGHGASKVMDTFGDKWKYVMQKNQLGTGHAVMEALSELPGDGALLVLCGDTPLMEAGHLQKLVDCLESGAAGVATTVLSNPAGYGRVIRDKQGLVKQVVEDKDASPEEKEIKEVNTGTYCFDIKLLRHYLPLLNTENVQKEYYLPDVLAMIYKDNLTVGAYCIEDCRVGLGINNRAQLAEAAFLMRDRINQDLMHAGVTLIDPGTAYIETEVEIGPDTVIEPNCILEGNTIIGEGCRIGPGAHLVDAKIGDRAIIEHSVVRGSSVGKNSRLGPFVCLEQDKF